MSYRFPRLSLLAKMAFALIAVGLLPLGILSYQLIGLNRDAMTDQVLHLHAVAARAAAARVEAFLFAPASLAAALASNPALLEDPGSPETADLLAGALEAQADLAALAIYDLAGGEVLRAQRKDLAAEVAPVLAAKLTGTVAIVKGAARSWLRVDAAVGDGRGVLRLASDARLLFQILHPEEIVEEADLVLASQDEALVIGSMTSLQRVPRSLVEAARSRKLSGAGQFAGDAGEEVLGAYAPVGGSPWFVLSLQPLHVAEAVAKRMGWHSVLAVATTVLLAGLLSAMAYRSMVRPIRDLVRAQRRLAGLSEQPRPGNEIEQLRSGFALLARRVHDNEAVGNVFLGRYKVLEVVGEGGMGTVFHAWDPKLRRDVAIKTIRFEKDIGAEERGKMVSGLLNEAVSAARFIHPNIVAVYDVADSPDATFLAMEFVRGTSLAKELVFSRNGLGPERAVPLALGIAKALEAAHAHGMLHRDIKPGNVLLGSDGSIKVTDFGLAAFASAVAGKQELVFGTPGYLPPESLLGRGYSPSGDLFALGAVLYACLLGRLPFHGRGPEETARKTIKGDVAPPRQFDPRIPETLEALILGLLQKDPKLRPSSAEEVALILKQLSDEHGWRWVAPESITEDVPTHEDENTESRSRFLPTVTGAP